MERIDLNDWNETGAGAFGKSYFHKTDPHRMMKLLNPGISSDVMEAEMNVSNNVYNLGIPCPQPGYMVTDGERIGVVFERLIGKKSYARMLGDNPQDVVMLAKEYAELVKELHKTPCDTSKFISAKEMYRIRIETNPFRSEKMKAKALEMLEAVPDAATCIHGDLHFGNMVKAEGKRYFIDLGDFSYGYPLMDLGMFPLLIKFGYLARERFFDEYHCDVEIAEEFFNIFLKEYFGQDTDIERKNEELMPYLGLRMISVETVLEKATPSVLNYLFDEIFG